MDRFKLEERVWEDTAFFAARCLPLGLTAYGDTPSMAWDRLKSMFGMLVDVQKKRMEKSNEILSDEEIQIERYKVEKDLYKHTDYEVTEWDKIIAKAQHKDTIRQLGVLLDGIDPLPFTYAPVCESWKRQGFELAIKTMKALLEEADGTD